MLLPMAAVSPNPPPHTHTHTHTHHTHLTTAMGSPSSYPPKGEEKEKRSRGKPGADRREKEELRVGHCWSWSVEEKMSAPARFSPPQPSLLFSPLHCIAFSRTGSRRGQKPLV